MQKQQENEVETEELHKSYYGLFKFNLTHMILFNIISTILLIVSIKEKKYYEVCNMWG